MPIEIFHTHWNGDCPYEVMFNDANVSIKRRDKNTYGATALYTGEPIMTINNYVKKYIGDDNGNTVLVETTPKHFTYIGDAIFTFVTTDDIVYYMSSTGNSDIPYPYAKGTVNTYLMLDRLYIPNQYRLLNDPYSQLYEKHPREEVYNTLKQNHFNIRRNTCMTEFYRQNFPLGCNIISKYNYKEFDK